MGRVTPIDVSHVAWRRVPRGWAVPCSRCRRLARLLVVAPGGGLVCPACTRPGGSPPPAAA
jgi:hypothetical protein